MIEYENECVGCPPEMGCLGTSCPNKRVPHRYCDGCGDEIEREYFSYQGKELCVECLCDALEQDGVIERCAG